MSEAKPADDDVDLRQILDKSVDECVRLRMAAQLPGVDASSKELLDCLLDVRARMDRVEELLATGLQLRGLAARKHTVLRIQVDDAWDEVAVRQRQHAVRDEYSSARERAAVANLEVLDLRRLERGAELHTRLCDEAVESIKLRLRGLGDVRQDVMAIIRTRQWESTLDR